MSRRPSEIPMANDGLLKLRVFAVIDTNVVVSSLLSDCGNPAEVMGYVESGNVIPLYDDRTLKEYEQVLSYARLGIDANKREETLRNIKDNGVLVTDVRETERQFVDKDDVPFFEIKVDTEDDLDPYLVTGNKKHFPVDDSHIVTPSEMVRLMRQLNSFVEKDWYYPKDVAATFHALLDNNPKYVPGKKCAESFGLAARQAAYDKLFPKKKDDAKEKGQGRAQGPGRGR